MDFLPIFLNVKARPCLVVGGGEVAYRKASVLAAAGATVTVVAPALADSFSDLPGSDLSGSNMLRSASSPNTSME